MENKIRTISGYIYDRDAIYPFRVKCEGHERLVDEEINRILEIEKQSKILWKRMK